MNYSNKRAFTLIELLVVIAIIGLLSSVVLASLSTARAKARDARRAAMAHQWTTALEMYNDANNSYPPAVDSGGVDVADGTGSPLEYTRVKYLSTYLSGAIQDPDLSYTVRYVRDAAPYYYGIRMKFEKRTTNVSAGGECIMSSTQIHPGWWGLGSYKCD